MLGKLVIVILVLVLAGAARLPFEKKYAQDLVERRIMAPEISLDVYSDLKQSSFAGVLGGLRTVVASVEHLKSNELHGDLAWYELKKTFKHCTTLDPYNSYYWQAGGWHMAYNAASDARHDLSLSDREREVKELAYMEAGEEFYRNGAKMNPDDPKFWSEIGRMWRSIHKQRDFRRSAEAYGKAVELGGSEFDRRAQIYSLSRVRGEGMRALELIRQLKKDDPYSVTLPTSAALYWVLHHQAGVPEDERPKLEEVFSSKQYAYQTLHNFKLRSFGEGYPTWGIDEVLKKLAMELNVPIKYNSFLSRRPHMILHRDWLNHH